MIHSDNKLLTDTISASLAGSAIASIYSGDYQRAGMYLPIAMSSAYANGGISRITDKMKQELSAVHEGLIKKDIIPGLERWAGNVHEGLESTIEKTTKGGAMLAISLAIMFLAYAYAKK